MAIRRRCVLRWSSVTLRFSRQVQDCTGLLYQVRPLPISARPRHTTKPNEVHNDTTTLSSFLLGIRSSVVVIVVGGAYVILQFIRCLWAAVEGLTVREFMRIKPEELKPFEKENAAAYQTRIDNRELECFADNVLVVDDKISQLKLAHRALKNALGGLLFLVIALGSIAIYNAMQPKSSGKVSTREEVPLLWESRDSGGYRG
jgi:hypothetical protein